MSQDTRHQISWSDDIATPCQMFFSLRKYDHEVLFNKKMQILLVKIDVLLSMHYLILAMLFNHAVPVYTCVKCFAFTEI